MKQTYRRFCAVLLILCLLCGCAAEKEVTVISLPGEEKMAVEEQNAPEATPTAVRGKTGEEAYHLELQKCVPENLSGITALTVLGDTIIAGGSSETGPSLVRFQVTGGETQTLDVPDGADYLYALCENPGGGFFLLSGSLPAGYWDERGNFTFLSGEPEGRLVLSRYDASFSLQETTTLEKRYTESGARFFQMTKTDEGLALLSASMLVWLDDSGAETARQELDPNDGWAFAAMQERDGILFVLTRDLFGGEAPELRAFDAKTLTPLEAQTLPSGTVGLGLGEDGTFLLTNSDGLSSYDLASGTVQTIASWRELGAKPDAEQIFQTENGYVLFSPNGEAATTLFRLMESQVLGKESPLYGRRTGQFKIEPLDYKETAVFHPNLSAEDNSLIYGITGGVPHYINKLDVRDSVDEALLDNFFDRSSYLYEEPGNLLKHFYYFKVYFFSFKISF